MHPAINARLSIVQVPWTRTPPSVCASAQHRAVALAAARESIVLLNNSAETSALRLPWPAATVKNVAVIGAYAKVATIPYG